MKLNSEITVLGKQALPLLQQMQAFTSHSLQVRRFSAEVGEDVSSLAKSQGL